MTAEKITSTLTDAFSLLDFSEKLISEIETAPLSELPRIVSLLRKNIRDAKKLISDAESQFDEMVRNISEAEERAVLSEEERKAREEELVKRIEQARKEIEGLLILD